MSKEHFFVKCTVCSAILVDHVGSTPCCVALAYICDIDGNPEIPTQDKPPTDINQSEAFKGFM